MTGVLGRLRKMFCRIANPWQARGWNPPARSQCPAPPPIGRSAMDQFTRVLRDKSVANELANKLPRIPDGICNLTVTDSNGKEHRLRAVSLYRVGDQLVISKGPDDE